LETLEQVVIDYLQGVSISKLAAGIGYDPRTVSRWLKRILSQAEIIEKSSD
jgi:DNA-binding transcriptional ArsR family regulator